MQSPQSQQIVERFFKALQYCIDIGRIKSRNWYCTEYGFIQTHMWRQEKDPGRKIFEISWMTPLITKYDISAYWLMTGEGEMVFKSPPDKKLRKITPDLALEMLDSEPCYANVVQSPE